MPTPPPPSPDTGTDSDTNTPLLAGKTVLITGSTSGLGRASALALSRLSPSHIYISGRNTSAAQSLISQITTLSPSVRTTFLPLDLADLSSVARAAETILSQESKLDILLANAGIAAAPPGRTKDGYEVHFGTNHVGHALLVTKLLPLLEVCGGRVVSVTSFAFRFAGALGGIPLDGIKGKGDAGAGVWDYLMVWRWMRYAESKLANVVWARELARRHPGVMSVSVSPGFVETEMLEGMRFCDRWGARAMGWLSGGMVTAEEGARNQIRAATVEKSELVNGAVYEPVGKRLDVLPGAAADPALGERLWEWTEKEIGSWL
ncbi:hypothetical protein QBC34DRAFT_307562 [Podospora aff. communis PSN243]|uniref:Oxidoreductase n=1 Tax=Podospora aff. communis PSN243 TaxID=3040156 RepID=A0AAV9G8G3_9PEZI|nr:hypothetical protein QBC34DRAFT_307562 [Podospora aff. communis PSN243]